MRERRYLTFDMENKRHRKAFSLYLAQSNKLRSEFVVNCILASEDENNLEINIRQIIREALKDVSLPVSTLHNASTELRTTENVSELPDILLASLDEI